jgi:hypothetical protein
MEVKFTDSAGSKRVGIIVACKRCKKEYPTRIDQPKDYCSLECGRTSRRNGELIQCRFCKKDCYKPKARLENSKHKVYFCSRKCKDIGQRIENGITEIWPTHFSTSNFEEVKRFAQKDGKCQDCNESRLYMLCIHHIDSDRTNNIKENLEILCYNCHAKRHMEKKDGNWVVNWHSLTPRENLKDL